MHRHALAIPRLARGSHQKASKEVSERALFWSKGNKDPLPYILNETPCAEETSFRRQVRLAGRAAIQASSRMHVRRKADVSQVGVWRPRRGATYGGLLDLAADEHADSLSWSFKTATDVLAHQAEVLAGLSDDAPVYLAPDEVDDLDTVTLVPYPEAGSSRTINLLPPPRSSAQLYQRLMQMINSPLHPTHPRPSPDVASLTRYHDAFAMHNSTKTYNLLIETAIRHTLFKPAWRMLARMRTHGCRPNLETEKLTTRLLVRVGRWEAAYARCWSPSGVARKWARLYPHVFWLEFFSFTSPAMKKWGRIHFHTHQSAPDVQNHVLRQLLQTIPALTGEGFDNSTPRLVSALVYHLLRLKRRDAALQVAHAFLTGLPRSLDTRMNRQAMAVVNSFMAFGAERTLSHEVLRDTFNELMKLHLDLRPGPRSLFLLMRSLGWRWDGAQIAYALLEEARARWGTRMEDSSVRRAVATLAFKAHRRDIAFTMFRREEHHRWHRRYDDVQMDTSQLLFESTDTRPRSRQRRVHSSLLRNGEGTENFKWRRLRYVVKKTWGKDWLDEELTKDAVRRRGAFAEARSGEDTSL
ncbi:hypothetical protein EXIGLDRAFT_759675 [Exidia glandulosa HHB12029]|uniref:Uncharacterized protein n=1 Tax=Exidia glandulosa HHB12029 TaxID=1314781 RepID=A0A165PQZ6_EXIGL|nr:hypothetical protein EXIGLDRAFT_759675 [Exidia glandulosa HHB12029]